MIVVHNTKELEENYRLDEIPDSEIIMVLGGLAGKQKYNAEKYQRRVTYPARQLKQIIAEMQEIESTIPESWNEWQKAKYIYEILAENIEYNRNREEYKTQQPSNLTVLLSRKGICAGYSLLYKEMMDRQGIACDYIRGIGRGEGMHAWNVLQIDGYSFGVDLTWDANRRQNGEKNLQFFGDDIGFLHDHEADPDEIQYNLTTFTKESINVIPTDEIEMNKEYTKEQKINAINLAIEKTYERFKMSHGKEIAKKKVERAILNYIKEGKNEGFTRQGMARKGIQEYVKQEDMVDLLIESYARQNQLGSGKRENALENAVQETLKKYNIKQVESALRKYIKRGELDGFTRQGNARKMVENYINQERALEIIIQSKVEKELQQRDNVTMLKNDNIEKVEKMYFSGDEFAQVELPEEKQKGIIQKAIMWIKNKTKERMLSDQEKEFGKNRVNQKENNYQR